VLALLASLVLAAAAAGATSREHVVNTAKNAKLGKTILVTLGGRTLYSLSAERRGKFICVDRTCLSFWKPLVVGRGVTPTGVDGLATVKRPDGRRQVSFRGGPLYTFKGDKKPGDVKGNGFKDVGTWHVVVAGKSKSSAPPPTSSSPYHY
jgi:predicted lipoprotein with Yx(FWY)xxD motif